MLVGARWAGMGMATVLGTGDSDGEMDCTGDRGGQARAPGLVWRLLDHTEPQSVSLACASSLTKPEPEPSSCIAIA